MTAHELAQKLLAGPDLPVHLTYPAGDYWRTTLTRKVVHVVEHEVVHSDYHRCDVLAEEDNRGQLVVILK